MIRSVAINDATEIADIYNYYILNSSATFETETISREEMKERIVTISGKFPWLVYEAEGKIQGYAYASAWRQRYSYRFSTETTIYLRNGLSNSGIGSKLYEQLLLRLKESNFHCVIGGIAIPNKNCIALHEKFGFEKVAHFKEVGFKFDEWVDVTYWEKIF